ncbi:hypothetical protein scyTo_0007940 [Scyliorhinus torazame]|uniref:Uncharacterized protein n=1 Tax=Scyliorhinus torazame TaxID=75743 RepID=A0A401P115_SCYTO|nr:hypothetical protein [Scyliorhinus torazame]
MLGWCRCVIKWTCGASRVEELADTMLMNRKFYNVQRVSTPVQQYSRDMNTSSKEVKCYSQNPQDQNLHLHLFLNVYSYSEYFIICVKSTICGICLFQCRYLQFSVC